MTKKSKVAIVTGSTSGIGLGIAHKLCEAGYHVMLNGFGDPKEIKKIVAGMKKKHKVNVDYDPADMTKPDEIEKMIKHTVKVFKRIDLLVNNAGIQFVAPVEKFPDEKWDQIIAINLSSSFHTIKHVIPVMKKQKFGRIVNIASVHGLVASEGKAAYVTAKHGLIGLTKVVALDHALSNITCNAICPGWVYTPLVEAQIKANAKKEGISVAKAKVNLVSDKMPTHKFVTPEQIAKMVIYLASDDAESITGSHFTIDGGWTAE